LWLHYPAAKVAEQVQLNKNTFYYRAMLAQLERGDATVSRPSVCPSVRLSVCDV